MHSLRLDLILKLYSGLGSFHLSVLQLILRTVGIKKLWLERKITETFLQMQIKLEIE